MFRIAHISDLHIPPLPRMRVRQLVGKRLLGLYSWHHKWKAEHREEILDSLLAQLDELQPDHVCVTGDLTFTTHPEEVDAAAAWLTRLGPASKVSLIPGNHDAYAHGSLDYALERWAPWMQDDDARPSFPYLQRRGPVDIIGLSSAVATLPGFSSGRMGEEQIARLEALLGKLADERRPRLLLIHHPPQDGATNRARGLTDRHALQALLARSPVDLVLHGHLHRPVRSALAGPDGPIPVLGAASASTLGQRYAPAHYHVLEVDSEAASAPVIRVRHSHYDPVKGAFLLGESVAVTAPEAKATT